MWIKLDEDECEVLTSALKHCNLHGLNFIIKTQNSELSPVNPKHTKPNAVKAAQVYFGADDIIINSDYVIWEENGDALVMCWQKVPSAYISEDCGCDKAKG